MRYVYGIYIGKWFPSQIHQIPTSCARNSAKCLCWENWICWEILYGFSSGMCSPKPSNPRRYVHLIFDFSSEWKIALRQCEVEKGEKKTEFFQLFLRNSNRVQSNFRTRQYILHQRLCVHNGRDGKHSRASAREIAEKWIIIIRFNISNKSYGSFCRVAALHHTSKSEKHASANDMHLKFICAHLCHWRLWWRYVRMPLTGVTINFSEHF